MINIKNLNKKGQLTLFVILGVIIIAFALFLIFKPKLDSKVSSSEFDAVFSQYKSCIEETARQGLDIAGTQGGRIEIGEFAPGSEYAPSSSHLGFMGFEVPYWYYVSANGVIKEQVPKKSDIERELEKFIEENVECDFDSLYAQGFAIEVEKPDVKASILDEKISLEVIADVSVSRNSSSAQKKEHKAEIGSEFGKFYNDAIRIYQKEKEEAFLEKYAEDVLRLYAPVDGVELECSPTIWKSREVVKELKDGLEANIASLKIRGGNHDLKKPENKYFVIDEKASGAVNFLYSQQWPTKVEIHGGEGELLIAQPIGNEAGLGMMGFCYSPYHFVYDVSFPVMVQIYSEKEVFQFPLVIVIDKNVPREAVKSDSTLEPQSEDVDVCEYKTQSVKVETYDVDLNSIDANISYTCFEQECELGSTDNGIFEGLAPACVSGLIRANADGYKESKRYFSSNTESKVGFILDKMYPVELKVSSGASDLRGEAIVYFESENDRVAAALPENSKIELSEGFYNVSVYIYGNSSITIPASTKRECTEVTSSGILGFFGSTKEKCFDINVPETKIEKALIGGGKAEIYLFADDLAEGYLTLSVPSMPTPNSLEALQYNYEAFEGGRVSVLNE